MKISLYTEIAVAVALAAVLDFFKIPLPHLLYGGSVSLETLPLIVVALRHGMRPGFTAGVAYGIVNFMVRPIVVHPVQIFLDYPLAFGLLGGGCGVFGRLDSGDIQPEGWRCRFRVLGGILAGNGLRLAVHFTSGIVFFASYAPDGQPVWLYSLTYNASYLLPEAIIHIFLLQMILRMITLKKR